MSGDCMDKTEKNLSDFIIESRRFADLFERVISKLPEEEKRRYAGRLDWYKKQMNDVLQNCGYKFADLSGEIYDSGMALTEV